MKNKMTTKESDELVTVICAAPEKTFSLPPAPRGLVIEKTCCALTYPHTFAHCAAA